MLGVDEGEVVNLESTGDPCKTPFPETEIFPFDKIFSLGTPGVVDSACVENFVKWWGYRLSGKTTNTSKLEQISLLPDSKFHGANMRPIWGRQDPGGPHVGPMNFASWDISQLPRVVICNVLNT